MDAFMRWAAEGWTFMLVMGAALVILVGVLVWRMFFTNKDDDE